MDNLQSAVSEGTRAQEALENPIIDAALTAWDSEIHKSWQDSPLRDVEGRERLRLMLEASKQFRKYLLTSVSSGKVALAEIRRQTPAEKVRQWIWPQ